MRGARVQVSGAMARVTADGQTLILRLTPAVQGLLSTHRKLQRLRWGRKRPPRPVTGERGARRATARKEQPPTRQLELVR